MKQALHGLLAIVARLNPRERLLTATFIALLAGLGILRLVIVPIREARTGMQQRVATLTADLATMERFAIDIAAVERDLAARKPIRSTGRDFSLFSFVDRAASRSVSRDAIESMNPSRRALPDGQEEAIVELRLAGIPLTDMVALLREIERSDNPAYVKRLELKRRYNDHQRFDAIVVAAALGAS